MAAEESDKVAPWTIRGIPPEERNAAIEAAKRENMSLGPWLQRAIRTAIQQEREAQRAPVPVRQDVSDGRTRPVRLSDREKIDRVAASLRELAAAGVPIDKGHAEEVTAALLSQLPGRSRRKRVADDAG